MLQSHLVWGVGVEICIKPARPDRARESHLVWGVGVEMYGV